MPKMKNKKLHSNAWKMRRKARQDKRKQADIRSGKIPICHKDKYGLYWVDGKEGKYLEGVRGLKFVAYFAEQKRCVNLGRTTDDHALSLISSYVEQNRDLPPGFSRGPLF